MLLASTVVGCIGRMMTKSLSSRSASTTATSLRREDRFRFLNTATDIMEMERSWGGEEGKIVVFVRHGESKANVARDVALTKDCISEYEKDNTLTDAALTEVGIQQAAARQILAELLKPELICSSPLTRAIQTGLIMFDKPIGDSKCPFVVLPDAREYYAHLSECRGRPRNKLLVDAAITELPNANILHNALYGEASEAWGELWDTTLADGDGFFEHTNNIKRYDNFRRWIMSREERVIVCVCHWGTCQYFVNRECVTKTGGLELEYIPLFDQKMHIMQLDNCSITCALFQGVAPGNDS